MNASQMRSTLPPSPDNAQWVPIFRAGRYEQLRGMVPDGRIGPAELEQLHRNTTRMISSKSYTPVIAYDHEPKHGDAAGWLSETRTDGKILYAKFILSPQAKTALKEKRRRWVSAEIVSDFNITGDLDGERIPGLLLKGIALLGRDTPQLKGLCDLTEIEFSALDETLGMTPDYRAIRCAVSVEGNAVRCFSELQDWAEPGLSAATPVARVIQKHGLTKADFSDVGNPATSQRVWAAGQDLAKESGKTTVIDAVARIGKALFSEASSFDSAEQIRADFKETASNSAAAQRIHKNVAKIMDDSERSITFAEGYQELRRKVGA